MASQQKYRRPELTFKFLPTRGRFYHSSRDWDVRARLLCTTTTTTWRWHCLNFIGSFVCSRRMTKWLKERVLLDALSSMAIDDCIHTAITRTHHARPSVTKPKARTCLFPLLSVFDHYSDAYGRHTPFPSLMPSTHGFRSFSRIKDRVGFAAVIRLRPYRRRHERAPTGQAKIGIIVFTRDLPRTSGPKPKTTQTTFVGK